MFSFFQTYFVKIVTWTIYYKKIWSMKYFIIFNNYFNVYLKNKNDKQRNDFIMFVT